jgi:hypothetical protein
MKKKNDSTRACGMFLGSPVSSVFWTKCRETLLEGFEHTAAAELVDPS